ncbi:MAG: stage II sporulation protein R [Oscillospiraceae bacterium]|jgi:stage II sporulation protein R|nr:stage II sporulation protein R [Oscillospiraceae bacterium]
MKLKIDIALLIGLIITLALSDFTAFKENYDDLQNDVLRMHILANSDSEQDQSVKLKVRDALLKASDELFEGCNTQEELLSKAKTAKAKITEIANKVLKENGFDYTATVEVVNMHFDDRVYEDITMPAGEYEALRITLGEASGHNWWCVMYPPLCLPYAFGENEMDIQYFTAEEVDILKKPQKYHAKFKFLEILRKYGIVD